MQTKMIFEACARCGQPVRPGEPSMQTTSIDVIDGKVVASPPRTYHLEGSCYADVRRRERVPNAA